MLSIPGYKVQKKVISSPLISLYEGLPINNGIPTLFCLVHAGPFNQDALVRLKDKLIRIKDLHAPCVPETLEIRDHPLGLLQIYQPLNGLSLSEVLPRIKGNIEQFLETAIQLGESLGFLHQSGIIHQGIHPAAIRVHPEDRKIAFAGFGFEVDLERLGEANQAPFILPYASPEQTGRTGREPDHRSDLYSLGIVLYEILAGAPPFPATDSLELLHSHLAVAPIAPHRRDSHIPPVLSLIVMKLLNKSPEERYQSASGLIADLDHCLTLLRSQGKIDSFPLGEHDRSLRIHIPEKLVGRDKESKGLFSFVHDRIKEAFKIARDAERRINDAFGQAGQTEGLFYLTLATAALFDGFTPWEKRGHLRKARKNLKQMKKWAEMCPENFLHKYFIMAAEVARVSGKPQEAMDFYERGIEAAQKNGFIHHAAMGLELAGKFYLKTNNERIARTYLREAHAAYAQWGATVKVKALEEKYSFLNPLSHPSHEGKADAPKPSAKSEGLDYYDTAAILQFSKAISREISLKDLLKKFLWITGELSGAERGFIITQEEGEKGVTLETRFQAKNNDPDAPASEEEKDFQSQPIEKSKELSYGIVQYVLRSRETLILNNPAKESPFVSDPYVAEKNPKSVLCMPMIGPARLMGILYLENNLASDTFTPEISRILNHLSSQAAISMENAVLYDQLKESETRLQSILDNTTAVIYLKDPRGRYLLINQKFEELFDITRKEIIGKTDKDLFPPEMAEAFQLNDQKVIKSSAPVEFEEIVPQSDGNHTYLSIKFPLFDFKNEIYGVCGISTDITARKNAEHTLQQFSQKTLESQEQERKRIAAELHDSLAQNMLVIANEVHRVLSEPMKKEVAADSLEFISTTALRSMNEIKEISFNLRPPQLDQLGLKKTIESLAGRMARSSGINLRTEISLEKGSISPGKEIHLYRIVQEGLNNIIKHSKADQGVVEIKPSDRRLDIKIKDNGQGFIREAMKEKSGGHGGFGLKGMEERARMCEGAFLVHSRPGEGTTVKVSIPL